MKAGRAVFQSVILCALLTGCSAPDGQSSSDPKFLSAPALNKAERSAQSQPEKSTPAKAPVTTFYLVRHAEKILDISDPALTGAGMERAQALASDLKTVKLTKIYSTDTQRTRQTAEPTAAYHGLDITLYDASDLKAFARSLRKETGAILIVGHSNTTPPLVKALGGKGGKPIVEANEYDRFYTVTHTKLKNRSSTTTELRRYGTPTP